MKWYITALALIASCFALPQSYTTQETGWWDNNVEGDTTVENRIDDVNEVFVPINGQILVNGSQLNGANVLTGPTGQPVLLVPPTANQTFNVMNDSTRYFGMNIGCVQVPAQPPTQGSKSTGNWWDMIVDWCGSAFDKTKETFGNFKKKFSNWSV